MISYIAFSRMFRLFEAKAQPRFASVKPDKASIQRLKQLAQDIGLPADLMVEDSELHATVCYSRDPIEDPASIIKGFLPITAKGDKLHFFESRKDGKQCLVLKLTSLQLRALWSSIMQSGASHDFPTYEAHVTLCYDTPPNLVEQLENYDIKPVSLLFTKYETKRLDLDWTPS